MIFSGLNVWKKLALLYILNYAEVKITLFYSMMKMYDALRHIHFYGDVIKKEILNDTKKDSENCFG